MMRFVTWFVVWTGLLTVGCIGSPEPRNPLKKPAVKIEKVDLSKVKPAPTSVKCLRCVNKNHALTYPLLTDEEKEILKRTDEDLEKLYPKVEVEREKKVY
jgi:peroxiredoxin